ncbi:MAG TPA: peptide chain release factor N(5)-glutamine methyltransferase [Fibrobacteria bacterium]|nr:peptide chain release factor N(5)-glutamine methyltransferase [Fibrobacteria bacterium]
MTAPNSLLDILNKTSDWFKGRGIESHRLDAQLLLGHVLGMKRLDLYMNFDRPMGEAELARYRDLVKRRGAREPLQHLVGEMPFREIRLKIDRRALIPRQETELIVDLVRKALEPGRASTVLDMGVGAGPIYLSVVKEITNCKAFGADLSAEALQLTRENAALNGLSADNLAQSDLFSAFPQGMQWDLIVSNPPYVGEKERPHLQPEVRDHDPALALFGGPEGWEFPARLAHEAYGRLQTPGTLIVEIGAGQLPILKEKSASRPWKSCLSTVDYQGTARFLILHK